jgi:hypothetical protein
VVESVHCRRCQRGGRTAAFFSFLGAAAFFGAAAFLAAGSFFSAAGFLGTAFLTTGFFSFTSFLGAGAFFSFLGAAALGAFLASLVPPDGPIVISQRQLPPENMFRG